MTNEEIRRDPIGTDLNSNVQSLASRTLHFSSFVRCFFSPFILGDMLYMMQKKKSDILLNYNYFRLKKNCITLVVQSSHTLFAQATSSFLSLPAPRVGHDGLNFDHARSAYKLHNFFLRCNYGRIFFVK
jgi:hypothetical protein